jgi:hypothetical protein
MMEGNISDHHGRLASLKLQATETGGYLHSSGKEQHTPIKYLCPENSFLLLMFPTWF